MCLFLQFGAVTSDSQNWKELPADDNRYFWKFPSLCSYMFYGLTCIISFALQLGSAVPLQGSRAIVLKNAVGPQL
jgi:hypothetical protein